MCFFFLNKIYAFLLKKNKILFFGVAAESLTVDWGDFGHLSNWTNCISLLLMRMPMALPEKLES